MPTTSTNFSPSKMSTSTRSPAFNTPSPLPSAFSSISMGTSRMNFTGGRLFLPRCPRAVFGLRLMLRDHAGSSLQHGHGMHVALVIEELRHADLLAENSSYLCHIS